MLRITFTIIVTIHGLIHLMGFAKAFKFAEMSQLTQPISRFQGVFWLVATILFLLLVPLFLLQKDGWWVLAIAAVILSQLLIIFSWRDAKFGTIANLIVLVVTILGYAGWRFHSLYEKDVKAGLVSTANIPESILTEADLESLPEPVKNYIRYSGAIGKPKVHNFKVIFNGKIRQNQQSEWMPFTSEQYNFQGIAHRLFFMKAVMKGLPVAGYHCFKNGTASMDIRLLSLAKVQYQSGVEMNTAETVTFFNDMCCMAPATLIDKRIKWSDVKGNKVKAEFTNNNITITAWLYFNNKGELINFISDDRWALDAGKKLRWSTPIKGYREMKGHKVPTTAEAVYSYPEGDLSYGTFNVSQIEYNYPRHIDCPARRSAPPFLRCHAPSRLP
jgi:hypothetical protein